MSTPTESRMSRRRILKAAAAAVGAAGAASAGPAFGQAPAVSNGTPSLAGKKFRAWVSRGFGPNAVTLQELTLQPVQSRQVVIRTEATQCCYTMTNRFLGIHGGILPDMAGGAENEAQIEGHGGVGIVEAVGSDVRRVQVGDRVIVNAVPQAVVPPGTALPMPNVPFATMKDGTPVTNREAMTGGLAELMVVWEEKVFPIFSKHSAVELSHLHCVGGCGLGMIDNLGVHSGSSVVIFGAGPVGISALQGARLAGATRIIVVEPRKERRDLALRLGATDVLNPNDFQSVIYTQTSFAPRVNPGNNIVNKVRDLLKTPARGGGFVPGSPDFVVEAVGHDFKKPAGESGPDGLLVLRWAFDLCARNSRVYTCGVGYDGDATITLPANQFADGGKWMMSGPNGRSQPLRDLARWSEMIEKGQLDAKSFVTVFPLEKAMDAYMAVADRSVVSAVVKMA
jgi:S-(hydroxymethyl)glutathione dehydrogenase / alcohol dehydrogenase